MEALIRDSIPKGATWTLIPGYRLTRLRRRIGAVLLTDRAVLAFASTLAQAEAAAIDLADFHAGCRYVPALMQAAADLYARHTDARLQLTNTPGIDLAFTPGAEATFLTANPALLHVLRAALVRDATARGLGPHAARQRIYAAMQPLHAFRDHHTQAASAPPDRLLVIDEAQRCWTATHAHRKTRNKPGTLHDSEPALHLGQPNRAHRAPTLVAWVDAVLANDPATAAALASGLPPAYQSASPAASPPSGATPRSTANAAASSPAAPPAASAPKASAACSGTRTRTPSPAGSSTPGPTSAAPTRSRSPPPKSAPKA